MFLVVSCSITGQFEDFSSEVFENSGKIYWSTCTTALYRKRRHSSQEVKRRLTLVVRSYLSSTDGGYDRQGTANRLWKSVKSTFHHRLLCRLPCHFYRLFLTVNQPHEYLMRVHDKQQTTDHGCVVLVGEGGGCGGRKFGLLICATRLYTVSHLHVTNTWLRAEFLWHLMLRLYQSSIRCCRHKSLSLACLRYYSSQSSGSGANLANKANNTEQILEDEDEVEPLPLLQRPLGVREPPTTVPKSSKEQLNDMLDQNKRMEHRRHLYVFFLSLVIHVPIC
jgi:hypothetical protein